MRCGILLWFSVFIPVSFSVFCSYMGELTEGLLLPKTLGVMVSVMSCLCLLNDDAELQCQFDNYFYRHGRKHIALISAGCPTLWVRHPTIFIWCPTICLGTSHIMVNTLSLRFLIIASVCWQLWGDIWIWLLTCGTHCLSVCCYCNLVRKLPN